MRKLYVSKFVLTSSFLDFSKYITRISIIVIFRFIELSRHRFKTRDWKIDEVTRSGQQVDSSSSGKNDWLFIERGRIDDRTFHRSGGGTMAIPPTRFRQGGLQNIGQFHQLVGRTGLIFKQTLTGSVPKWMTRNRYPVDTCYAPAGITCYLHLCIRPVRVAFATAISVWRVRLSSRAETFSIPPGLIMAQLQTRRITNSSSL